MKPLMNLDEIAAFDDERADGAYAERSAVIGAKIGAVKLGYSLSVVPPGKRVCPFHNHRVNEEMFLILEGHGLLRFGDKTFPVKPRDIIACPPGGRDVAHQIINTGDAELRYLYYYSRKSLRPAKIFDFGGGLPAALCLSTREPCEIVEYPDSDKIGIVVGHLDDPQLRHVCRARDAVDYWDGER